MMDQVTFIPAPTMRLPFTALLCLFLTPLPAWADIVELLPRIKPAVVGVGSFHPLATPRIRLMGTGFVVADGRHVVTNAHVLPPLLEIERGETLALFSREADQVRVRSLTLVERDDQRDLALLRFEAPALPALRLGQARDAREGGTYFFTGYPIGAALGLYPVTHRAGLAAIAPIFSPPATARGLSPRLVRRAADPFLIYQLDATAYPGNSGSPLYDPVSGLVIGVINSVYVRGAKENALREPSGISYAIPVQYVRELLEQAGLRP